jgi:hypothetical protein
VSGATVPAMETVRIGMSKRQVKRLLGRPHQSTSLKDFLGSYGGFAAIGGVPDQEYWLYVDVPPGSESQVVFQGGRVAEVRTVPTPS